MRYLLNGIYIALIIVLSPWILWSAIRKGKYRQGWAERFLGRVPLREGQATCVWFHAVSVGEVNLLVSLVREFECRHPDWEYVVSSTTKTGLDLAWRRFPKRAVFQLPLDFSWAVRRALGRIRPDLLVLVELELWPNLLRAAREQQAQVAIVNGRLSDRSFRGYRRIRWYIKRVLSRVNLIAVQSEAYAERFVQIGADRRTVHVTGSTKFDGAEFDRDNPRTSQLRDLARIGEDDSVFLAGSTQDPEERMALAAFFKLQLDFPHLRLILVPRHPERFDEVAAMLDRQGVSWQRRTRLDPRSQSPCPPVLLVDAVGELASWWGTASVAFVGGSLSSRGGQNMIEPAAYGVPISFGPNTWNFRDTVQALLDARAAVVVHDQSELTHFVRQCIEDRDFASPMGQRAQGVVSGQQGATLRTVERLESLLDRADQSSSSRDAA